jgi:hypothetical protein
MSTYTINKTNGEQLVTVPEATINTTACSVALVGRRAVSYGEATAENFVKLCENFAHAAAPSVPMVGQIWYNTTTETLNICVGNNPSPVWREFADVSDTSTVIGQQLVSTTTDEAPFIVSSSVKVIGLNADMIDGFTVPDETLDGAGVNPWAAIPLRIVVRDAEGDVHARLFEGTATSAQYADVAERFEASEPVEAGDVVEIGGDKEIVKATGFSFLGVISTAPALRMNDGAGSDETHPFVAFAGRLPCKVTGPVSKGDRLVSNGDGTARAQGSQTMAPVVGRALEDKSDDGVGKIMIVVGVK